jgi:hypothetical protein
MYGVSKPVKLQKHCGESHRRKPLRIPLFKRNPPPVGIKLDILKPLIPSGLNNLSKIIPDSRLATRNLDIERAFFTKLKKHIIPSTYL